MQTATILIHPALGNMSLLVNQQAQAEQLSITRRMEMQRRMLRGISRCLMAVKP